MTVQRSSVLLADRPIGDSDDQLWKAQEDRKAKAICAQLDQIAATFVQPLAQGAKPSASLTVAVTGHWGAGKSSALRVLCDRACEKARALAPAGDAQAADALASRLVFVSYVAPVWERAKLDPRTTLVARMLVSLAGSDADAVKDLLVPASAISQQLASTNEPGSAEAQRMWASITLEQIAAAVSRLRDYDELLRSKQRGKGGESRVVVVLVDDLDRCAPSFVYALLNELQQLGGLDNFFFVVAAEWSTLCQAVRECGSDGDHTQAEAEHELEKLVQHAVCVPPLDLEGARALVDHLLEGAQDAASRALRGNIDLLFTGLPEPTPRALKRCLNFLASRLADGSEGSEDAEYRRAIKTLLIEHTWEDFYRRYFQPMTSHGPSWNIGPIAMLEQAVCRAEAVDGSDRRIVHELAFVSDVFPSLPWRDLPIPLVRFLGTDPSLVAPEAQKAPPLPPAYAAPPPAPPAAAPPAAPLEVTLSGALSAPVSFSEPDEGTRAMDPPSFAAGDTPDDAPLGEVAMAPGGFGPPAMGPPPEPAAPPAPAPAAPPSPDTVLSEAVARVTASIEPRARLEHAVHAIFDLASFQPKSDQLAIDLGRALLPELCKDPRDGRLLSAALDRYVTLLRRYGLRRTAGATLDCAYRSADYVSYVRDAYSLYLLGAGAVEAARRVGANQKVEYREVLTDDAKTQGMLSHEDPRTRALVSAALSLGPGSPPRW